MKTPFFGTRTEQSRLCPGSGWPSTGGKASLAGKTWQLQAQPHCAHRKTDHDEAVADDPTHHTVFSLGLAHVKISRHLLLPGCRAQGITQHGAPA